jgi:hypothetical protein
VETDVALPAETPGKEKPTAELAGQQIAAELINSTRGVDAWSGLSIGATPDGRARVVATAYFPDITHLRFSLPLTFVWRSQENGTHIFGVERVRSDSPQPANLSDEQVKSLVSRAQADYATGKLALQTSLEAFTLRLQFTLPGDIVETHVWSREDHSVSLTLEGKKIAAAFDRFMADDAALAATIKSGKDLSANDEMLLNFMYGEKGPIAATVKVAADTPPQFDYAAESRAAREKQDAMLKAAGVDLVPRFVVRPSATQP